MSRRTYYMWRATQLRAAAARQRESSLAMREAEAIIREGMLAEGETSNTFGAATAAEHLGAERSLAASSHAEAERASSYTRALSGGAERG